MSRRFTPLTLAALLCWPLAAWAQYDHLLNASTFGQQAQARVTDQGQIEVLSTAFKPIWETITKEQQVTAEVEVDGEKRTVTKTVQVPVSVSRYVTETRTTIFQADTLEAYDMAGKRVEAGQLKKLLEDEKTILVASRKVPRYFLSVYKPDTLLIVAGCGPGPESPPVGPPAPLPGPALVAPVAPGAAPDLPLPPAPRPLRAAPVAPPPPGDAPAAEAPARVPVIAGDRPMEVGLEPLVGLAKGGEDWVTIRRYVKNVSKETATREVADGKQNKQIPVQIDVESIIDVERKYPLEAIEVYRADGKEVEAAEVKELLAKDVAVLVSTDGKEVEDRWLKIVKPETLVIVVPHSQATPVLAMPPLAIPAAPAIGPPLVLPPAPVEIKRATPAKPPKPAPAEVK